MGNLNISDFRETGNVTLGSDNALGGPGGTPLTGSVVSGSLAASGQIPIGNGAGGYAWAGFPAHGIFGTGAIPLAGRYGRGYYFAASSNGTDTGQNARIRHVAAAQATSVRLLYTNPQNAANSIVVSAGLEDASGYIVPVYFGGKRAVTIDPDGFALSDPIPAFVAKNTAIFSRTRVTVTGGQTWHISHVCSETGELCETGTATTDKTLSGTIVGTSNAYGPSQMFFDPGGARCVSVLGFGDSIMDTNAANTGSNSFVRQACEGLLPCMIAAKGGAQANQVLAGGGLVVGGAYNRLMWQAMGVCTHVVEEFGVNDVYIGGNSLATLQANKLAIWTFFRQLGVIPWATTLTPESTSTDAWATVGNQTMLSQNGVRTGFNDWVRAGAPIDPIAKTAVAIGTSGALLTGSAGHPLAGYFEIADVVESARNSGLWKAPSYTADGIHPLTATQTLMAAVITPGSFV